MKSKILVAFFMMAVVANSLFAQKKEFGWLIGKWKLADQNVFETWTLGEDGKSLVGVSMKINGNESTILEETKLIFSGNSFYYIADVAGDQDPVDFSISFFDETSFVAENAEHDFPKLIRYKIIKKDGKEFIEAAIEGGGKVIPYTFDRVQ